MSAGTVARLITAAENVPVKSDDWRGLSSWRPTVQDQARTWAGDGTLGKADRTGGKAQGKKPAEPRKLVIVER